MATTGCRVDVKNGTLSFDVGDDDVEFNLFKSSKFAFISDECRMIVVVDGLIRETMSILDCNNSLEHLMLNDSITKDENPKVVMSFLEASP